MDLTNWPTSGVSGGAWHSSWASSAARNFGSLYRPSHKGSEGRSGSFGQGAHAATPRPVAVSTSLKGELSGLGCGIRTETKGADPRTVHSG